MKLRRRLKLVSASVLTFLGAFLVAFWSATTYTPAGDSFAAETNFKFALQTVLELSVDLKDLDMKLMPGQTDKTVESAVAVTSQTNSMYGHRLFMSSFSVNTDLVNRDPEVSDSIKSITTGPNLTDNSWGYRIKGVDATWGEYKRIPKKGEEDEISSKPSLGTKTTSVGVGIKAGSGMPFGVYKNALVFTALANYGPKNTFRY